MKHVAQPLAVLILGLSLAGCSDSPPTSPTSTTSTSFTASLRLRQRHDHHRRDE